MLVAVSAMARLHIHWDRLSSAATAV
jgi:hypothetical protein